MGLVSLLFSFKGRANRQQYWFGSTGVGFAGFMMIFGAIMMAAPLPGAPKGDTGSPMLLLLALPVFALMMWAGLAIQVKRFHDRNQPGWLVALQAIPGFGVGSAVFSAILANQSPMELGASVQPYVMLGWLINFAFFINLGCMTGTDGPNKYGDPPRWWGEGRGGNPAPRAPSSQSAAAMPGFLSGSSMSGAASAIDRAIAEGPRAFEPAPVAAAPAPATARAPAAPAPASFGRAPASGGGFGKKR